MIPVVSFLSLYLNSSGMMSCRRKSARAVRVAGEVVVGDQGLLGTILAGF
jgi:hypothetical protein